MPLLQSSSKMLLFIFFTPALKLVRGDDGLELIMKYDPKIAEWITKQQQYTAQNSRPPTVFPALQPAPGYLKTWRLEGQNVPTTPRIDGGEGVSEDAETTNSEENGTNPDSLQEEHEYVNEELIVGKNKTSADKYYLESDEEEVKAVVAKIKKVEGSPKNSGRQRGKINSVEGSSSTSINRNRNEKTGIKEAKERKEIQDRHEKEESPPKNISEEEDKTTEKPQNAGKPAPPTTIRKAGKRIKIVKEILPIEEGEEYSYTSTPRTSGPRTIKNNKNKVKPPEVDADYTDDEEENDRSKADDGLKKIGKANAEGAKVDKYRRPIKYNQRNRGVSTDASNEDYNYEEINEYPKNNEDVLSSKKKPKENLETKVSELDILGERRYDTNKRFVKKNQKKQEVNVDPDEDNEEKEDHYIRTGNVPRNFKKTKGNLDNKENDTEVSKDRTVFNNKRFLKRKEMDEDDNQDYNDEENQEDLRTVLKINGNTSGNLNKTERYTSLRSENKRDRSEISRATANIKNKNVVNKQQEDVAEDYTDEDNEQETRAHINKGNPAGTLNKTAKLKLEDKGNVVNNSEGRRVLKNNKNVPNTQRDQEVILDDYAVEESPEEITSSSNKNSKLKMENDENEKWKIPSGQSDFNNKSNSKKRPNNQEDMEGIRYVKNKADVSYNLNKNTKVNLKIKEDKDISEEDPTKKDEIKSEKNRNNKGVDEELKMGEEEYEGEYYDYVEEERTERAVKEKRKERGGKPEEVQILREGFVRSVVNRRLNKQKPQ